MPGRLLDQPAEIWSNAIEYFVQPRQIIKSASYET
jgi:hypothetical protein